VSGSGLTLIAPAYAGIGNAITELCRMRRRARGFDAEVNWGTASTNRG
jgi:hypothetical protein